MKFISKKNTVCLTESGIVLKRFSSHAAFERECGIYEILTGKLDVPKIISKKNDALELEYIDGLCMVDILTAAEVTGILPKDEFCALCDWISEFHKTAGLVLNDVNLRNFIYSSNKVYGIEFEDVSEGDFADDYAKLLAFIELYAPQETPLKHSLCDFLSGYISGNCEQKKLLLDNTANEKARILRRRAHR